MITLKIVFQGTIADKRGLLRTFEKPNKVSNKPSDLAMQQFVHVHRAWERRLTSIAFFIV